MAPRDGTSEANETHLLSVETNYGYKQHDEPIIGIQPLATSSVCIIEEQSPLELWLIGAVSHVTEPMWFLSVTYIHPSWERASFHTKMLDRTIGKRGLNIFQSVGSDTLPFWEDLRTSQTTSRVRATSRRLINARGCRCCSRIHSSHLMHVNTTLL